MDLLKPSDDVIQDILQHTKTIALIGATAKPARPAYKVMCFLQQHGYKVAPVNPGLAGGELLGEPVYACLADVPAPIHMVDIFRNADAAGVAAEEAIQLAEEKSIHTVWMQEGIINEDAARAVQDAGLRIIMDRCPKKEWKRLFGTAAERP